MHIIEVLGRILLSSLFLIEGVRKFFFQEETIMYMEEYGVPEILFFPSLILEILFPILLIIGYKTRISALIMALFTLTVAIIFHTDFQNQMELIIFLKDIAIAGGFLIIAANEPKICSIDYMLKSRSK
jgi:putative oxidoreductase